MSRPLRSAFIATVSAATLAGCSSDRPIVAGNPPEPAPTIEPSPTASAVQTATTRASTDAPTTRQPGPLNPKNDQGRTIHRSFDGGGCFVYLPFPPGVLQPPGAAPPSQPIDCPDEMGDPAFQACKGGVVHLKQDGQTCQCIVSGNPPRVTDHACPK